MQREAINNTWKIEPNISTIAVTDSFLKISFGAGTANQIKFGIITIRKITKPEISKLNLYLFNNIISPIKFDFPSKLSARQAYYTISFPKGQGRGRIYGMVQ